MHTKIIEGQHLVCGVEVGYAWISVFVFTASAACHDA